MTRYPKSGRSRRWTVIELKAINADWRGDIDHMIERTGVDAGFVTAEVDRYFSWHGQALGYMVGQSKIIK